MRVIDRIRKHYRRGITYHELMRLVFPDQRSWNYQSHGGPPGCAMTFGRALRELGAYRCQTGEISIPGESLTGEPHMTKRDRRKRYMRNIAACIEAMDHAELFGDDEPMEYENEMEEAKAAAVRRLIGRQRHADS